MREINAGLGGFTLLQAPNMTEIQMMSYVLTSPTGRVLVIDGGNAGDADCLRAQILARGGHVDLWLITHCHNDHYDALLEIAKDPRGVTVGKIGYNFPPQEWVDGIEPEEKAHNDPMYAFLAAGEIPCVTLSAGDVLDFDGARIDVLADPADFAQFTPDSPNGGSSVNDTSLVFRFTFPNGKTALFLGDLGLRAGDILAGRYGEALKSDIVQMAHHGQNGAGENVYRLIRPEICLWTAPMWLYNNDLGAGFDTWKFKTVIVRGWMEKLGVTCHVVEGEGAALLR